MLNFYILSSCFVLTLRSLLIKILLLSSFFSYISQYIFYPISGNIFYLVFGEIKNGYGILYPGNLYHQEIYHPFILKVERENVCVWCYC